MNREKELLDILTKNSDLMMILDEISELKLSNWYVAAGSVFQSVWNYLDKNYLMTNVHDIDLVYFDDQISFIDSISNDKQLEKSLSEKFPYRFDVHNEAYMHLWQNSKKIPYENTENAIERWIATVHAIGISGNSDQFTIFAPYGIEDIFTKTIRPIYHKDNNQELYENKVAKWQERFSDLNIIKWTELKVNK
ncbi:MAG: nucleotidyltransferase family protein [Lactococcus cremoris]